MTIQIRPSIFVGVGTTGANILAHLQNFIFEEYQSSEFPVFSLVSILTAKGDNRNFSNLFPVKEIYLEIPSMTVIENALKDPRTDIDKLMKKWLPEDLFKHSSFNDGSKNIRPAGKLQFWANYPVIYKELEETIKHTIHPDSIKACRSHLAKTRGDDSVNIDANPNVYVFGALGGGTCSGMAPEMGYFLKNLVGQKLNQIFGVFTIPDPNQARVPNNELQVFCSNTYAALQELNYHFWYDRNERPFEQALPQTPIKDKPYDFVYLESIGNSEGADSDLSALEEMIALNLFLDVCSGTGEVKQSVRSNFGGFKTANGDNYGLKDSRDGYPHSYHSFGVSGIIYPKFRLARAAAAEIARTILSGWGSNEAVDGFPEEKNVGEVNALIDGALLDITREIKQKSASLIQSIDEEIDAVPGKHPDFDEARAADFVDVILRTLPRQDKEKYHKKLSPGGTIEEELNRQKAELKPIVLQKLEKFNEELNRDCCRYPELLSRWQKLSKKIDELIEKKPMGGSGIAFSELDQLTEKLIQVEEDKLLSMLLMKKDAVRERKLQILRNFRQLVIAAFKNLRAKVSASLLEDVKEEYLKNAGAPETLVKIAGRIPRIRDILNEKYTSLVESLKKPPQNIKYIYRGAKDSLELDSGWPDDELKEIIDSVRKKFASKDIRGAIVKGTDYSRGDTVSHEKFETELLRPADDEDYEKLVMRIMDWLTIEILKDLRNQDYGSVSKLLPKIKGKIQPQLDELAKKAAFYIKFGDNYYQGKNRCTSAQAIINIFHPTSLNKDIFDNVPPLRSVDWKKVELQGIDHFVIFSTEEPGFTTSLMPAWEYYRNHFLKELQSKNSSLLWTDKRWTIDDYAIDFTRDTRVSFLQFVLETVRDITGPDTKDGNALFFFGKRENGGLYFEIPKKGDIDAIRITVGDHKHYCDAVSEVRFAHVSQHLMSRFVDCMAFSGKTQLEDTFENFMKKLETKIENCKGDEKTAKEIPALQAQLENARMFRGFVRKRVFGQDYNSVEEDLIREKYGFLRALGAAIA